MNFLKILKSQKILTILNNFKIFLYAIVLLSLIFLKRLIKEFNFDKKTILSIGYGIFPLFLVF